MFWSEQKRAGFSVVCRLLNVSLFPSNGGVVSRLFCIVVVFVFAWETRDRSRVDSIYFTLIVSTCMRIPGAFVCIYCFHSCQRVRVPKYIV